MSDEIAALFPDTFEESELGPIPKGWLAAKMGNRFLHHGARGERLHRLEFLVYAACVEGRPPKSPKNILRKMDGEGGSRRCLRESKISATPLSVR